MIDKDNVHITGCGPGPVVTPRGLNERPGPCPHDRHGPGPVVTPRGLNERPGPCPHDRHGPGPVVTPRGLHERPGPYPHDRTWSWASCDTERTE